MAASGSLCHELELFVPASTAWELYGKLELAKLMSEKVEQVTGFEVVEGDGGVGTVLKLVLAPGLTFAYYTEKYTIVDNEKRVKVSELVEGGFLQLGFTQYRTRYEIIEKGNDSSIIKSTIEYEAKEEAASTVASIVSLQPMVGLSQIAKEYLATK